MKNQLPYIFTLYNRGISSMSHENKIPEISVMYNRGIRIKIVEKKQAYPVDYIIKMYKTITHEQSATLHLYIVQKRN